MLLLQKGTDGPLLCDEFHLCLSSPSSVFTAVRVARRLWWPAWFCSRCPPEAQEGVEVHGTAVWAAGGQVVLEVQRVHWACHLCGAEKVELRDPSQWGRRHTMADRGTGECSTGTSVCPTLCDPVDSSLPGSSVRAVLQARIPEWVVLSSSRGSSQPRDGTWVSWCHPWDDISRTPTQRRLTSCGLLKIAWVCKALKLVCIHLTSTPHPVGGKIGVC